MAVNEVNTSELSNLLGQVQDKKNSISAKISKARTDYNDDKLFNSSVLGSEMSKTDLNMNKINSMTYAQIQELLKNTPSDAQINSELENAEKELNQYIEEFEQLNIAIKKIQVEIANLQNTLKTAQEEKLAAEKLLSASEKNKETAEEEVSAAQKEFEVAKNAQAKAMSDAENKAYEDAIKAYEEQEAKDDIKDEEKKLFGNFLIEYRNKAKITSSYDASVCNAAEKLASKKASVNKYEMQIKVHTQTVNEKTGLITKTQNAINQRNTELDEKQIQLNTVSNNINLIQVKVNNLETKMATRNFINKNQKAIDDIAYEKNPETIQARVDINTAEVTVKEQLAIAQVAEKEAAIAATNGDKITAEAKNKEAEDAKAKAEEAKKKADEAKSKMRETDSALTKLSSINSDISALNESANKTKLYHDVTARKVAEIQTARDQSVSYATYVNIEGNTEVDKACLDLTKMINSKELEIVEKYGLDLSECVEKDGLYYPKYVIAKGTYDGAFHIYQRSETIDLSKYESNLKYSKGISEKATDYFAIDLARIYGNGASWDICAPNNGYMIKYGDSETPKDGMTEVYYITSFCDFQNAYFEATYKSYETNSPLSFDLNDDGVKVSDKIVEYDIDADGILDKINDSADAILCFDKDGDGISGSNGSECFGNNTDLDGDGKADGYKDGFEALKSLAERTGLINNNDDMELDTNDIKFLEEKFGLKLKVGGYNSEAKSLFEYGISAISIAKTNETAMYNIDNGNQLMKQVGAVFIQNGKTKEYADIWHRKLDEVNNPFSIIA